MVHTLSIEQLNFKLVQSILVGNRLSYSEVKKIKFKMKRARESVVHKYSGNEKSLIALSIIV